MPHETIVILGIPVDNLSMDDAIEQIFSLVEDYQKDKRARLVATVNVDFLVNSHAWFRKTIRHPELLHILRRADLVTADGMPIVWASRLLGTPLKERVTGADLVPRLAEEASKRNKSLFFLGGRGDVGQQAATLLQSRYPGLRVADVYAPFVHVEGEALLHTEAEDQEIVERINRSKADILLIGFGNPKQEIWFERNRLKLKVPVSIGIGGTYEFIVGSVSRAPQWMQQRGLEWIYRITQDPRRLIKRYFIGFFKFGFMLWPALLSYRYQTLRLRRSQPPPRAETMTYQADVSQDVRVVRLPARVDAHFVKSGGEKVETAARAAKQLILDLSQTDFIDSSGLGLMVKVWKGATEANAGIYFAGIRPAVVQFFKMTRLWDLFSPKSCEDVDACLDRLKQEHALPPFYMVFTEESEAQVVLRLSGRLDALRMAPIRMEEVLHSIGERDGILDLSELDFVDGSGLFFFLKIQKALAQKGKECCLCSMTDPVRQVFRISKLIHLFRLFPDVDAAKKRAS